MPRIFTDIDDTILKDGQPVQKVIDYIDEAAEEVVVLTNRPESDREKTVADLEAIDFEYDALVMNDSGAEAPAFKAGVIKAELDAGRPVDLFIDNRADTREAVAALGVEVMDPANVPDVVEEDADEEMPAQEVPEAKVANLGKVRMTSKNNSSRPLPISPALLPNVMTSVPPLRNSPWAPPPNWKA